MLHLLLFLLGASAAGADEILIVGGEYSAWTLQVYDPNSEVKNKYV